MATTVKELVATFGLETDKASFAEGQRVVDGIKKAATTLVTLFATGAVAKGFGQLVGLGSDAAETLNVIDAAFGENQEAVLDWAAIVSEEIGRSEFALREMAASTGALVQPMLGSRKAAADMSTQVAQLAVDLGSFFNEADEDALRALRSGLVGQSEPLLKFGVNLQQATLQAFALTQGITKSINEMSLAEKTNLRFQAILAQTTNAQGDAAKTARGFANASKALKSALKDIATTIGLFLLPAVEKDLQVTLENVRSIKAWIDANKELIGTKINAFLENFFQVLNNVVGFFKNIISLTIDWVQGLTPLQKRILGIVVAIGALVAIMFLPAAPILALIGLIALLIDDFETWRKGGVSVIGDIIAKFKEWFAFLEPALEALAPVFTAVWESLRAAAVSFFDRTAEAAEPFIDKIKELVASVLEFDFKGTLQDVKTFFQDFGAAIQKFFNSPVGKLLLTALGAVLGAKAGELVGSETGRFLGELAAKSKIPGAERLAGFLGEKAGGALGKLAGGITGAVAANRIVSTPSTGGISSQQTSSVQVNLNVPPGANEEAIAQMVADKVTEAQDEQNRAALDVLASGPAG